MAPFTDTAHSYRMRPHEALHNCKIAATQEGADMFNKYNSLKIKQSESHAACFVRRIPAPA